MGSWEPDRGRLLEFDAAGDAVVGAGSKLKVRRRRARSGRTAWRAGPTAASTSARRAASGARTTALPMRRREGARSACRTTARIRQGDRRSARAASVFVNVGSSSDACRDAAGTRRCPARTAPAPMPRARRLPRDARRSPAFTLQSFKPYAIGLRNSLALAWTAPGVLPAGRELDRLRATRASRPRSSNRLRAGSRLRLAVLRRRAHASRAATKAAPTALRPRRRRCSGRRTPRRCR